MPMSFASGEWTVTGVVEVGVSSSSSPNTWTLNVTGSFALAAKPTLTSSLLVCASDVNATDDTNIGGGWVAKHITAELENGNVSIIAQTLKLPSCCTPNSNCKLTLLPLVKGFARLIVFADILLLKPPPFGCDGGCSNVVPWTVVVPPPLSETTMLPEVRGRKSAVPDGAGNVVRSMMRTRMRVMLPPVELVKRLRTEIVPNVELLAGSEVKSRTMLGDTLVPAPESTNPTPIEGPMVR